MGIVNPDAVHKAYPPKGPIGQATSLQVPSVGRVVHYVLKNHHGLRPHVEGEYRPAIIVRVWGENEPDAAVQLQVFLDGTNDKEGWNGETLWATSVSHDELSKVPGTWHFQEQENL